MPYIPYIKPYKTPSDIISDLKIKQLSFIDENIAEKVLSQINYYHFKIYLHPLLDPSCPTGKNYRSGEYFEDAVDIYRFDEQIRFILFKAIARIEIKLRSRLDQVMSSISGNPFWYLDNQWFNIKNNNTYSIDSIRNKISNEFSNTKEEYASHYKSKYYNTTHDNYKFLPPFWIACEFLSIGTILKLYDNLNTPIINQRSGAPLDSMALEFGAPSFKILCSWARTLRDIRNRCAHHSRLWNANLRAPSHIIRLLNISPTNDNRIYTSFAMTHRILLSLGIQDINLYDDLTTLIGKYHCVKSYLDSAGFPEKWHADPFWS
jgi:abortive infection bacteriophage resistance protein